MRALNIVLSAGLVAWIMNPPAFARPPESESAARPERTTKRERRSKLQQLGHRIAELETANADLERLLERYRKGLERTMSELGRLRLEKLRGFESSQASRSPSAALTTPQERALPGGPIESGRRILSHPEVYPGNGRVVVRGEIYNPRREHLRGELVIELLRDGKPFDEMRIPLELPASDRRSYAEAFVIEGYAIGAYSARVGLVY